MVRTKVLAVHLMSQHDTFVRVHNPIQLDGCAVETIRLGEKTAISPRY
jgi:hypothetical protein